MIENIPLPRLLNGSGGTERRIHPQRVSINLAITPLSDATMELSQDESLPARGYVELYTCMGSAGIFRVRSPQDSYGTVSTTAELEHAIVEVGDYLVRAKYDEMMAANTAIQTLFGYYGGSKWQLGSISAIGSGQVAVKVNYDRILDAILGILEQKPECMLAFDFSTTPWTVSIVSRETIVSAEGRLARNVNYAKVTYDDTELCTRAYYEKPAQTSGSVSEFPVFNASQNYSKNYYVNYNNSLYKLPNGHEAGVTWENTTKTQVTDVPTTEWAYVDADTMSTYGLIEREVRTGSNYTADEALRVAQEYIRVHKHPRISVEIGAAEMSHITGESLDSFNIGKLYRLALADYNVTVEKTVTNLYFADVYGLPDSIVVNLAEEEDTALNFIHDLDAKGGGGGGGGGSKGQDDAFKEYRTRFEMDDYHIRLQAERVDITEHILQQAGLYIDSLGVLIYAEDNENNIGSKIAVEAGRITAEVTRATDAESALSGRITVEANRISLVVEGTGANAAIKPAAIVAAINGAASTVKISADHIVLDGTTLASKLLGTEIVCNNLHTTTGSNLFEGHNSFPDTVNISSSLTLYSHPCDWKSKSVITSVGVTSFTKDFKLADDTTWNHSVVTSVTKTSDTIYYLGY